jgi:hypothetical protein
MDNIKMDLVGIGWGHVDWVGLAQGKEKWRALVNAAMNFRVSYKTGKLSSGYATDGLSSSAEVHTVK